jgi:acyl carrier protein phosphodiesterase
MDRISDDVPVSVRAVLLQWRRAASVVRVSNQLMANTDLDVMVDHVLEDLVVHLTKAVLAEQLARDTESVQEEVPASWWQHAKADFGDTRVGERLGRTRLGRWAARRWPVRMQRITLSVTWSRHATRPYSTLKADEKLGPIVYREDVARAMVRW